MTSSEKEYIHLVVVPTLLVVVGLLVLIFAIFKYLEEDCKTSYKEGDVFNLKGYNFAVTTANKTSCSYEVIHLHTGNRIWVTENFIQRFKGE